MTKIAAADLFCGAGGTSTGLLDAAHEMGLSVDLVAINHWSVAISTHTANHPEVRHRNDDLEKVDPHQVVPGGTLKLLVASPECTHFSNASGGMPKNKQSRASVKYVLRWLGALDVENVLIENVPEFQGWGPLHRTCSCGLGVNVTAKQHAKTCEFCKPIKARKGEYFRHFIAKLRSIGYTVEWRVLNAADYGDATTRRRLFIMARKSHPIQWPKPTHSRTGHNLAGDFETWRSAREIIDWSKKGQSIFRRKKPLADNTMKRIEAGLQKFSGLPFVLGQQSGSAPRTVNQPLPTIAGAGAIELIQPFVMAVDHKGGNAQYIYPIDRPLPTLTGQESFRLVEPIVIQMDMGGRLQSVDVPLNSITSADARALVQPFLITTNWGDTNRSQPRSIDEPVPTIMGNATVGLVEPFIVSVNHGAEERASSIESPLPTITGFDALGLAQPFVVMLNGTSEKKIEQSARSVDEPLPALVGTMHAGLAEPYLVEYHGNGKIFSVDDPLPTQTSKDRFGLVEPMVFQDESGRLYMLDILFRMLMPKELAGAMSFPDGYQFDGTRDEVVKQIGNAVPRRLAKALCGVLLG